MTNNSIRTVLILLDSDTGHFAPLFMLLGKSKFERDAITRVVCQHMAMSENNIEFNNCMNVRYISMACAQ